MKKFAALTAVLWAAMLPMAFGGADAQWFRGVDGVSTPAAAIDDPIVVQVRDLDGWLLSEIVRKHITGETHFTGNQFQLFIDEYQQARAQGLDYGDLMETERERLDEEFKRLAREKRKAAAAKVVPAAAVTPAAPAALGAASAPPSLPPAASALPATSAATAAPTPAAPASTAPASTATAPAATAGAPTADEQDAAWKKAFAKAESDQETWFNKWQAWQAYRALFYDVKESLYLVLNGHRLTHVKASNPFDAGKNLSTVTTDRFQFVLKQNPDDKTEWDKLYLGMRRRSPAALTLGFEMEGKTFTLDSSVQPGLHPLAQEDRKPGAIFQEFALITYSLPSMIFGLGLVVAAFIAFLNLASRTDLVRDPDCPARPDGLFPFSLARCQMAFWFFLFAAAYVFLWVVKRQTDTLTDQCLVLLGISTGTTLGAAILAKTGDGCPPSPPVGPGRPPGTYPLRARFQRFFDDILSDHDQISFHRFQMVVWTFVLGLVFVQSVCAALQMPQFGANELTLMGISAGTYIGFKIPGASNTPPPPDTAPPPPAPEPPAPA